MKGYKGFDKNLKQENQQYKNAWEELKNKLEKIIATTESMQVHDYVNYVYADMQELEQKHNLDKEQLYMNKEQLVRKEDKDESSKFNRSVN